MAHPDSSNVAKMEDEAWEFAVTKATAKEYHNFIQKYPNTVRATAAQMRISGKTPLRQINKIINSECSYGVYIRDNEQNSSLLQGLWKNILNVFTKSSI